MSEAHDLERLHAALRSGYKSWIYWNDQECPKTLIEALSALFPEIDSDSWPDRLKWGGAYVNGKRCLENIVLSAPARIEYYFPKDSLSEMPDKYARFRPEYVIYQDEDVAVVFKPADLPSMPAREQIHFNLKSALENLFGVSVHLPSRLDVSVSGIMAVSRSVRMHAHLQQAFEHRQVSKEYILATSHRPEWASATAIGSIARDPKHPVLRCVDDKGDPARTEFAVIESGKDFTLISAKPYSGRTHQIRVHAASLGCNILGDNFYNGREAESLHLVSYRVRFFHPFLNQELDVSLPKSLIPAWAGSSLS